jgi:hypothetical protein
LTLFWKISTAQNWLIRLHDTYGIGHFGFIYKNKKKKKKKNDEYFIDYL